ncbi:pRiA4b ORF-3-like protein [Amycolatopsis xylanica]|uniref:PRiA4b ORF-3-like protein n=1 Tax=Amycolatopsis xylanica TaxID=589385 RepID=A0A1H3RXD7_9PSEU|nr:plasmid pRiA4b ORF-3 family protein [Amycolatopsis xylanica]SDZ30376.1 pRiA4b ORF-3-like protein [Amycolatopsis xylanica]
MSELESALESLASAARACPALVTAQALAEWVGTGKEVTTRGVLKPAAAIEACDLLGIKTHSRKPRSALDISELMMVWSAASAAGFIEVSRAKVMPGPALRPWLGKANDTALAIWLDCVLRCLSLSGESAGNDVESLIALATLHERGGVVSLGDLGADLAEVIGDPDSECPCPECASQDGTAAFYVAQDLSEFGIAVVRKEIAELTPLGRWLTDFLFRISAPPADADVTVVISELTTLPSQVVMLMARPWLERRDPAAAANELLAAAEVVSGQERLTALTLARGCGKAAETAWREWAAKDGIGAYARIWLAEQDDADPADADLAWTTADTLAVVLDTFPTGLAELPALLREQLGAELDDVLAQLEDSAHPAAPRLTELLESGSGRRDRVQADYQVKVQLLGVSKPPVWRRLRLSADIRLDRLHDVVQAAMGWDDSHLHVFSDGEREYGFPDPELGHFDERNVRLSQVISDVGEHLEYTYDFGDDWEHRITLEKVLPASLSSTRAFCTGGKGACPPEDCGGDWGYARLKATLADPEAEEHADLLEWLGLTSGDEFDAGLFSAEEVNRRLG